MSSLLSADVQAELRDFQLRLGDLLLGGESSYAEGEDSRVEGPASSETSFDLQLPDKSLSSPAHEIGAEQSVTDLLSELQHKYDVEPVQRSSSSDSALHHCHSDNGLHPAAELAEQPEAVLEAYRQVVQQYQRRGKLAEELASAAEAARMAEGHMRASHARMLRELDAAKGAATEASRRAEYYASLDRDSTAQLSALKLDLQRLRRQLAKAQADSHHITQANDSPYIKWTGTGQPESSGKSFGGRDLRALTQQEREALPQTLEEAQAALLEAKSVAAEMLAVGEAAAQAAKARIAELEDECARLALEVGCRPTLAQMRTVQWQLAALRRTPSSCPASDSFAGTADKLEE
ncbi:hypothetical protein WJX73_003468 [Symbiochloris irregularis]|uniref:Uncharacterized protein n=1 Tax=Symbiochloris irregularis TaxID=706552 RepID=A0AAW1Q0F8_9CHLO